MLPIPTHTPSCMSTDTKRVYATRRNPYPTDKLSRHPSAAPSQPPVRNISKGPRNVHLATDRPNTNNRKQCKGHFKADNITMYLHVSYIIYHIGHRVHINTHRYFANCHIPGKHKMLCNWSFLVLSGLILIHLCIGENSRTTLLITASMPDGPRPAKCPDNLFSPVGKESKLPTSTKLSVI